MSGTIVNKSAVANELAGDILNKSIRFSLESVDTGVECTNASVDSDCNYSYENVGNFTNEYRPYIDNLREAIKGISDSMEEKDRGFFGF